MYRYIRMGFWNSIGNGIKRIAKKTWNGIKTVGGRVATTGARIFKRTFF